MSLRFSLHTSFPKLQSKLITINKIQKKTFLTTRKNSNERSRTQSFGSSGAALHNEDVAARCCHCYHRAAAVHTAALLACCCLLRAYLLWFYMTLKLKSIEYVSCGSSSAIFLNENVAASDVAVRCCSYSYAVLSQSLTLSVSHSLTLVKYSGTSHTFMEGPYGEKHTSFLTMVFFRDSNPWWHDDRQTSELNLLVQWYGQSVQ